MIRLTLNAQTADSEIHLFNKSTILIGSESGHVDLILPSSEIQPIHLKIAEQNGFLILINYVNDPFVTVNGHPFGKKLLHSGDIIALHQITILFEILNSPSISENDKVKEDTTQPLILNSSSLETSSLTSFSFPFEHEVEALSEEELQKDSLEKYLKELESSREEVSNSMPLPSQEQKPTERKSTASLKDDYLRDLEDDNQSDKKWPFGHLRESSHLYQAWKWILLFIFSLLAISGIIGTIIYFSVTDKTEAQETKAAQGVADIAMALTHAQLNQLKPHNHNWSDVDFLKTNLQAILPDTSSYASQIDTHGQFNCCPYSLRIYTSSDLSHFLLIAQPAPSLLNWLIPQSVIVVDSHLMELRILKDVRHLNRLLANPDPLDGPNGKEITLLVKQGGLIRLAILANDSGHFDFAPPKNLAWLRPGAENLIYNAPRYYRLGHHIFQKAMSLSTSKGSSQAVAALKQDVEHLSWLNPFILYSDRGKKSALLARQGLMMFAPSNKLLFGYLLFNAQGKIHQVHLLKDDEEWKDMHFPGITKETEVIALHIPKGTESTKEDIIKKDLEEGTIDTNHPIYIQLHSLLAARENELRPLATDLSNLITQDLLNPRAEFQLEFQDASYHYLMANAKHKQVIKETLDNLYHQYEDIPLQQFLAFINALNLEQLIQHENQSISVIDENCHQNIDLLLKNIEKSQSLVELDNLIHNAGTWLNFNHIKDPHELVKYQNLLRNRALEQLEKYLLSQNKHSLIKSDDKDILQHILTQERLIKPEEKDFFLEEFDEIITLQQSQGRVDESDE